MRLRSALLILSLSSVGCSSLPSDIPEFPEVYQCAYSDKFKVFSCNNTRTGKHIDRSLQNPIMEAGQCLSKPDYQASEAWVEMVLEEARNRCTCKAKGE